MKRDWSSMTAAEKSASTRGRHRVRFLERDSRYVCSKRFCAFTDPNLTLALNHVAEANRVA